MHEDRHVGAGGELGGDVERHLPRLSDEHGGGPASTARAAASHQRLAPSTTTIAPAVDRRQAPRGSAARRPRRGSPRARRRPGRGGHDAAPARIAAAAAIGELDGEHASSSTSWYSIVAEPSSSAASARHSRR